jgi:hypothetical protein
MQSVMQACLAKQGIKENSAVIEYITNERNLDPIFSFQIEDFFLYYRINIDQHL